MKKPAAPRRRSAEPDVEELRARLQEAEDTLEAIRSGQVEAIVVSTEAGPKVFTLEGADHRYRRLVETMNEGALLVSPAGLVLYSNAAFAALVGARLETVAGRKLADFVDEPSSLACGALLAAARRGPAADEITLRSVTGVPIAAHVSMTASADEPGVAVIVTNLTAQKRNEEIVASERLASSILDQVGEAIVVCDPKGVVIRASNAAREIAAAPPLHEHVSAAFPLRGDDDRETTRHPASLALAGRTVGSVELSLDVAGRAPMSVLCSAAPLLNDKREILGCVMSIVNITRQKRAAVERTALLDAERAARSAAERARADAEASNRSKDEFLATVSHELRTPLNAIVGWSRLLSDPALPEERRRHGVEVIQRNAAAQARLIEELLDVSRIVSGKMRLEVHNVDLVKSIEAVIESVQPALEAKEIALERRLDEAAGSIFGDAARLQQVVWNLLSNATKFTPARGKVVVTLRQTESGVEISVADNGPGIAADFLPYVFDRFRQADGSISRLHGGLGLGLAISRHLVELHGGAIGVTSDGAGATFTVRLPRAAARETPIPDECGVKGPRAPARTFESADLHGVHVLIVEDDDDSRELLASMLVKCGACIVSASSGVEALAALANGTPSPHVIVSDIGMPEMDGYALIRSIRSLDDGDARRIPALALTAYARTEDRRRALAEGFQMHLAKPVDPGELAAAVASLVRGSPPDR